MKTFNNFVIYNTNPSHVITTNNPGGIYSTMKLADGAVAELFGGTTSSTGDGVQTFDVRITNSSGVVQHFGSRVRTRGVSADQVSAVLMEYQRRSTWRSRHNRVARHNKNR